jgi:hypothetical protein
MTFTELSPRTASGEDRREPLGGFELAAVTMMQFGEHVGTVISQRIKL